MREGDFYFGMLYCHARWDKKLKYLSLTIQAEQGPHVDGKMFEVGVRTCKDYSGKFPSFKKANIHLRQQAGVIHLKWF